MQAKVFWDKGPSEFLNYYFPNGEVCNYNVDYEFYTPNKCIELTRIEEVYDTGYFVDEKWLKLRGYPLAEDVYAKFFN